MSRKAAKHDKQALLDELRTSLESGELTEADVKALLTKASEATADHLSGPGFVEPETVLKVSGDEPAKQPTNHREKLSAVDAMFYIAGFVLFAALSSAIGQSWDSSAALRILLSAGAGIAMWALAYYLHRSSQQTDIRKGLMNSLLLTGSLSLFSGGFIIVDIIVNRDYSIAILPYAAMLAVIGCLHLAYNRLVRSDLILLIGVLQLVGVFPTLMAQILKDADLPLDVWTVVAIISTVLLVAGARVAAKANPSQPMVKHSYDEIAVFLAMLAMYISSFGDAGALWLLILIISILGVYYLSIVKQSKHLLGFTSFFLAITIITIAFKYFVGFGVSTSLIIAAMGLLGTAALASSINKKYFKQQEAS